MARECGMGWSVDRCGDGLGDGIPLHCIALCRLAGWNSFRCANLIWRGEGKAGEYSKSQLNPSPLPSKCQPLFLPPAGDVPCPPSARPHLPPLTFRPICLWPVQSWVCANSGRFLGAYCLADYNCDEGRPGSRQVCIRGRCCTKTRTSKALANRRTAEDRLCPTGTFSVGLTCASTRECLRKAQLPLDSPLPLLECSRQGKRCCTNSQFKRPLAKGGWCLNGGRALGPMNGHRQCVGHRDCRSWERPRALCVDRQFCTPRIRTGTGVEQQDGEEDGEEEDFPLEGEEFPLEGDNDLEGEDEDGMDGEDGMDDEDLDVPADGFLPGNRQLQEGVRICRVYGLPYLQVRRCSPRLSCGNRMRFRCISTHCCLRLIRPSPNKDWDELGDEENELPIVTDEEGNPGILPSGNSGYCLGTARFRRFLGQFCATRADCPRALDARRRVVPIRCLRGACCAALRRRRGQIGQDEGQGGGGLLPLRPANAFAFCFDGTLSRRQCLSPRDCPFPRRQTCLNGLCCAPAIDQQKYACGGLASAGQCMASVSSSFPSSATCRDSLYCVSSGACCECRNGQPQGNVTNCRRQPGMCKPGFVCDPASGFCCPRCADGQMPFGSCFLGKCAIGFGCSPGNICCRRRRGRIWNGIGIGEEDGDKEGEDFDEDEDEQLAGLGRIGTSRRRNPLFWDDPSWGG